MRRMLRSSSTTRMLAKHLLPYRNLDREGGARADPAAHENPSVVRLDDLLGDIQPQSGRAGAARGAVTLGIGLEDALERAALDSAAGVADHHAHRRVMLRQFDRDSPARRSVAQRISHQVGDYPGQLDGVAP